LLYAAAVPRLRTKPGSIDVAALRRTGELFRTFGEDYHEKQLEEAHEEFEDIEKKTFGRDGFEDAEKKISGFEEAFGIADIAQFTPPPPPKL